LIGAGADLSRTEKNESRSIGAIPTEITLVGWLISTPTSANPTLWFIGAFAAVLLGVRIFLVHRQIERRIDQIGKL
jgi:hypothetical protein